MLKLVGGTTWHWAAAAWRYIPNDMKLRSTYGVGRDWPIDYDDLEPWYGRAEVALGVAGTGEEDQSGQGGAPFPPRSTPYPLDARGQDLPVPAAPDPAPRAGLQLHPRAERPRHGAL